LFFTLLYLVIIQIVNLQYIDITPIYRSLSNTWLGAVSAISFAIVSRRCLESAVQDILLSIFTVESWAHQIRPSQEAAVSQTLFSFALQQLLLDSLFAFYHHQLKSKMQNEIQYLPTYLFMYLLAVWFNPGDFTLNFTSSPWSVLSTLKRILRREIWHLEHLACQIGQHIFRKLLLEPLSERFNPMATLAAPGTEKGFGGPPAIRAVIEYKGRSDKVAKALLEHGIFSAEYLQKAVLDEAAMS
jgi:hypothetical protein